MKMENALAVILVAALCGCAPDLRYLQSLYVGHVQTAYIYEDGRRHDYAVDTAALKPEMEAWQQAGFDGFGTSYVTYVPDVCISYKFLNSAPNEWPFRNLIEEGDVNFREDVVVVNEVRRNGSSQYVRDATAADRRFRKFLLDSAASGRFPMVRCCDAVDSVSR